MNKKQAALIITKFLKNVHCCQIDLDCIPFKKILFTNHGTYNIDNLLKWSSTCIKNNKSASYPCTREYIKPSILLIMIIRSGISYSIIKQLFSEVQHLYKEVKINPIFGSLKTFIFLHRFHLKSFVTLMIFDQINFYSKTIPKENKYIICHIFIQAMCVQHNELFLLLNFT